MSKPIKLDADWDAWNQVMRRIISLKEERDIKTALSEVDLFLAREIEHEVRSDALGMRADLKQEMSDLEGAKNDLLTARSIIGPSYGRYVHELSLGSVCQKQKNLEEALSWYRSALQTCLDGEGISAGTALRQFLTVSNQQSMSPSDQELCVRAIRRSWQVLALPGQPDLADISKTVEAIKDGEANPRRR